MNPCRTYATITLVLFCFLCSFHSSSAGGDADSICPGSPAWKHASCQMTIAFPQNTCAEIQSEISARLNSNSWIDPHNRGTYTELSNDESKGLIEAKRVTYTMQYTDLLNFSFESASASAGNCKANCNFNDANAEGGCVVKACSQSQVTSVLDFNTNYCNLRNLYCNSEDGCVVVQHDLESYEETYEACWQNKKSACIVESSSAKVSVM